MANEKKKDAQYYLDEESEKIETEQKDPNKKTIHRKPKKVKVNRLGHRSRKRKTPMGIPIVIILLILIVGAGIYLVSKMTPSTPTVDETQNVVAIVNGEPIYISTIEQQYNILPAELKQQITKATLLNRTIDELLLVQESKKQGHVVSEGDVDELINYLMVSNQITEEMLNAQLQANNMTLDDLREVYYKQMLITKLVNESVFSTLVVSEEDIKAYYETNIAQYSVGKQVRARHILVETEEEANDVIARLEAEESFDEIAIELSIDTGSGAEGGDLGYFAEGMMVPEFNDAAFSMGVADSPVIVQSQFGYHILDVTGLKEPQIRPLEEVEMIIEESLMQELRSDSFVVFIDNLRANSEIQIYADKVAFDYPEGIDSFMIVDDKICSKDGKPVVTVFSTTTCPHCLWIKDTVDSLLKEYIDAGKIVAHHWELDVEDDILTAQEGDIMSYADTLKFTGNNPGGAVPMYDFGCKYVRLGNGYENLPEGLEMEEAEMRTIIEDLLANPEMYVEEGPAITIEEINEIVEMEEPVVEALPAEPVDEQEEVVADVEIESPEDSMVSEDPAETVLVEIE